MTEMTMDAVGGDCGASASRARVEAILDASVLDARAGGAASRALLAILTIFLGAVGLISLPNAAQAQTSLHEVSFAHAEPNTVARFVVFVADTQGDQAGARQINVGKPANPVLDKGLYVYSAVVSVDADEYVAIAAVSYDGSLSALSNWSGVPPSNPGQPFYIP
jgi:hypothetical protein